MSIVQALFDATPMPPADADVDVLTAAFAAVHAARQAIMDAVQPPLVVDDVDRQLLPLLEVRQDAWLAALRTARDRVQTQRIGTVKLRGYAASIG